MPIMPPQAEPPAAVGTAPIAVLTQPVWLKLPASAWFEKFYPPQAAKAHIEGRSTIRCKVDRQGRLVDCFVVQEEPVDAGFGDAALKLAPYFAMRPRTQDGQSVEGGIVNIPIRFQLPGPQEPATDAAAKR
jgi:protein TonB